MVTWKLIALVATTFAVVGAAFDKLLLLKNKRALHDRLVSSWVRISDTQFPDLAKLAASATLSAFQHQRLSSSSSNLKLLIIWSLASFTLTTVTSLLAWFIEGGFEDTSIPLPLFPVYFFNWIFDVLTITITLRVLSVIKNSNAVIAIVAILLDIIIAIIFVTLCHSTTIWANSLATNYSLIGTSQSNSALKLHYRNQDTVKNDLKANGFTDDAEITLTQLNTYKEHFTNSLKVLRNPSSTKESRLNGRVMLKVKEGENEANLTYSVLQPSGLVFTLVPATVFVPTVIFLLILTFLIFSRLIFSIFRGLGLHILEVVTEPDPNKDPKGFMPGMLCGVLLGCFAAIVNVFAAILVAL